MTTPDDTTPDHTTPDTQGDPQSHVDHDPSNEPDADTDPAHDTGKDEGWESEGGANPTGPATD